MKMIFTGVHVNKYQHLSCTSTSDYTIFRGVSEYPESALLTHLCVTHYGER